MTTTTSKTETVTLIGAVTIDVVVDLESGTVSRVIVNDELVTNGWADALDDNGYNPGADLMTRAKAIADDAVWPAWEFSY